VSSESFVSTFRIDKSCFLIEPWKHSDIKSLSVDNRALSLTQHFLARNVYFFDAAVVKFMKLTFEFNLNIWLAMLGIDLIQIGLNRAIFFGLLNEWVFGAKELFENLEVSSLVDVASKLVLTLLNAILETEISVLVVDAFHCRVTQHLISLANLHELLVRLSFLFTWAAHRVIL